MARSFTSVFTITIYSHRFIAVTIIFTISKFYNYHIQLYINFDLQLIKITQVIFIYNPTLSMSVQPSVRYGTYFIRKAKHVIWLNCIWVEFLSRDLFFTLCNVVYTYLGIIDIKGCLIDDNRKLLTIERE